MSKSIRHKHHKSTKRKYHKPALLVSLAVIIFGALLGIGSFVFSSKLAFANWSLDSSFGSNGITTTSVGNNGGLYTFAIQSDGKIVTEGYSSTGDVMVARYNTDGSLDTTFGNNGVFTQNLAANSAALGGIAIQSDGKIVFQGVVGRVGTFAQGPFVLGRLNSDGTVDTGFGTNGFVQTSAPGYSFSHPSELAIQPSDGKIVAVGSVSNGTAGDVYVARYNTDGSLDTTFGSGGIVTTDISGPSRYDDAEAVAFQSDGKIVITGRTADTSFLTARYNTDGSFDTTFGSSGKVTEHLGNIDRGRGVAIQSDGKILVAGADSINDSNQSLVVIRYSTDGTHDTSFANNGIFESKFGATGAGANDISIQSDGKIVLGGWQNTSNTTMNNNWALYRLNSDSTVDTGFGNGGEVVTVLQNNNYITEMRAFNGAFIVGGSDANFTFQQLGRFKNNTTTPPTVSAITITPNPVQINTPVTANATFTSNNSLDNASWNWGDISQNSGTVSESNGSGTVGPDSHTYTKLGSNIITLTVTNTQNMSATSTATIAVIPAGGLSGSNLKSTNYSGANLSGQNISNSNLKGANLTSANLTNANLTNANLKNANLTNVNFSGANLTGVNANGATLTGIIWSNTTCPDGTNSNNNGNTCVGHGF